jgi:tetratricopeptide (TPR) repeat protein
MRTTPQLAALLLAHLAHLAPMAALSLQSGCASSSPPERSSPSPSAAQKPPEAPQAAPPQAPAELPGAVGRLPLPGGKWAPSLIATAAGPPVTGADLADVEGCGKCHIDALAQWRESAHALASFNNPIYRTAVDRLRHDVGNGASRFCAGCHDLALLVDGAMDHDVVATDKRAHVGVSCGACHGVTEARPDGNGSFTLTGAPVPLPVEGDAESLRRHRERVAAPVLRTVSLCASCHRSFLSKETGNPAHLSGMDETSAWMRSPYAGSHASRVDGPVEQKDCMGCHMPRESAELGDVAAKNGKLASHRFLGGHTYMASLRRDQDQLRRTSELLRTAATIDVAALVRADGTRALPPDGAEVAAGERIVLDVVVRNQRVGHRFPGGTLDAQDAWIELSVRDAHGKVIAEAGERHAATGSDPTAHVLRALAADEQGKPLLSRETHRFRAIVYNHTIAPRDASVVEYALDIPRRLDPAQLPLRVTARLRHRSRDLPLQEATCADSRTPRGAAFLEASRKLTGAVLSPCAQQPITDIAEAEVFLGKGSPPREGRPTATRLYEHGLGMLHAVQERLDEARPSLERALELTADPAERASALWALGAVSARQGRTDEASRWLAEAAKLAPGSPAIDRTRGDSLAQVWRWSEAAAPLQAAAEAAPRDDAAWAALALALGSAGRGADALEASRKGLLLQPRDADMLRVQALALASLKAPSHEAREAYLACRTPDDAPRIRGACSKNVPGCALERNPVHVHELRPK